MVGKLPFKSIFTASSGNPKREGIYPALRRQKGNILEAAPEGREVDSEGDLALGGHPGGKRKKWYRWGPRGASVAEGRLEPTKLTRSSSTKEEKTS